MSSNLPSKTARNYQPQILIQGMTGITKSGFYIPPHIYSFTPCVGPKVQKLMTIFIEESKVKPQARWESMGLWWPWWLNGGVSHQIPPGFNQHIFGVFRKAKVADVGNLLESGLEFLGDLWVIWKIISGCSKTKMESSWWREFWCLYPWPMWRLFVLKQLYSPCVWYVFLFFSIQSQI